MSTNKELEMAPLSDEREHRPQIPQIRPVGFFENTYELVVAHASYYRNITASILVTLSILLIITVLHFIAVSSTKTHVALTSITHDYTNKQSYSEFELKMKDVDHWCLLGGNDYCICDDPTIPMPAFGQKNWTKAVRQNRIIANKQYKEGNNLDVVFLGDQAIEAWNGRLSGTEKKNLKKVSDDFKSFFQSDNNTINGIALGIANDTITNLFWRLVHVDMPDTLKPKAWWISIGGNDLAYSHCSEEIVVFGILRIAEYIIDKRPGDAVIINSILPSHKRVKALKKVKTFDIWSSIQIINYELKKFCEGHMDLHFFDATNIFFTRKPKTIEQQRKDFKEKGKKGITFETPPFRPGMITTDGRLLPRGQKAWMKEIVANISSILTKKLFDSYTESFMAREDDFLDDDFKNN